jgi:phytanoyl-CoA hydroxylase
VSTSSSIRHPVVLEYGLNEDRLAAYREFYDATGYVAVELFPPAEVEAMRAMVADIIEARSPLHPRLGVFAADPPEPLPTFNPRAVYKISDLPLAGDGWFRLLADRRVLTVVSALIGPDVNYHMGFVHLRPPRLRLREGWHRDLAGDLHSEPGLTTAITYLDDIDRAGGATRIVPYSHLDAFDAGTCTVHPFDAPDESATVDLEVRAGTVVFLHCLTIHSAAINRTPHDRRIVFNEYKTVSAREVVPNQAAFAELPLVRDGRPFVLSP